MFCKSIWDIDDDNVESETELRRNLPQSKSSSTSSRINFHADVLRGLQVSSFTKPNKVQLKILPYLMNSYYSNLVICAPGRSGKTSSTILGVLDQLSKNVGKYTVSIHLSPTYEIAQAAFSCVQTLAQFCQFSVYFAAKRKSPIKDNKHSKEIFIGTPEKILNLSSSSLVNLKKVGFFVVDDADCLGNPKKYFRDIAQLHQSLSPKCRTVLCTTSMNKAIDEFLEKHVKCREFIKIENDSYRKFLIKKIYLLCENETEKMNALAYLLALKQFQGQTVVFCNTKHVANRLAAILHDINITAYVLTGVISVAQKKRTLEHFKEGIVNILITTRTFNSVIDVPNVTKLINYEQILDESYKIDTNAYRKRECLLSTTQDSLVVHFFEKRWESYLFSDEKKRDEQSELEILDYDELKTYF